MIALFGKWAEKPCEALTSYCDKQNNRQLFYITDTAIQNAAIAHIAPQLPISTHVQRVWFTGY